MNMPPAPATERPRLRPMGVGEIIVGTLRLYRENVALFLVTAAMLEVPAQIINQALAFFAPPLPQITPGQIPSPDQSRALTAGLGFTVAGALVTAFAGVFITAALSVVISNRYLNRSTTVGDAYGAVARRLGPLTRAALWSGLRLVLLTFASAFVIGLPFLIYYLIAWALLPQAVMLEGASGTAASGRSRALIRGYWGKALGLFIALALLFVALSFVPVAISSAIVASMGSQGVRLFGGLVSLCAIVLVRPIQTAATTLLFYDLKMRKEGFTLAAWPGPRSQDHVAGQPGQQHNL